MKLNKTFGRIATTLVATAMLASVAAVPAFAVNNSGVISPDSGSAITAITFNKELTMPSNVPVPAVTFNFSMDGTALVGEEVATDNSNQVPITAGNSSSQLSGTAVFTGEESTVDNGDGTKTASVTASISLGDLHFDSPGVYKYSLTEDALTIATKDDYTLSDADRSVYLYVEGNGASSQIVGAVIVAGDTYSSEAAKKVDTVGNYYMLTGDPDDPNDEPTVNDNQLTVLKTVTGDMGDKSASFTFSVTVGTTGSGKTYTAQYMKDGAAQGDAFPLTAGVTKTDVELSDGMSLQINGLSQKESYIITETDAFVDNYTTTIDKNNDGTDDVTEEEAVKSGINEQFNGNITAEFTNTREAVSPTGLIMDIAPYALLVVVAAAGCFVFLRKRRED